MMRKLFLTAILLNGLLFSSFAQEKWTLRSAVEYALANNISVKQQDIQARLAELTYNQSKLTRYPSLNMGTSLGVNTGRSIDRTTNQFTTESIFYNGFSLQTNVDLFNWFSKQNTIESNRYAFEASQASVDKLKNDIALNVAAAYLQALLNIELVNVSKVRVDQTRAQLENTRKLVNAGSVPELNALQLEAQLALDSSGFITAQGNVTQSMLLLKALMNVDAGAAFDIERPPVETIPVESIAELQPDQVFALALQNLPQQRVNSLRLKSAQKGVDAARGALYPSISLGASLQTNYSNSKNNAEFLGYTSLAGFDPIGIVKGTTDTVIAPRLKANYRFYASPYGTQISDNFSNGVGINISIPIFNSGTARTNLQRAKLNVTSYELQRDQDNLNLKQDIYKAYTDAATALQKFNAAEKNVESAEKAFEFAGKRYEIGLLGTLDLIISQSNLYTASINRLSAQFEYVFKMKVLEFYKGQGIKL